LLYGSNIQSISRKLGYLLSPRKNNSWLTVPLFIWQHLLLTVRPAHRFPQYLHTHHVPISALITVTVRLWQRANKGQFHTCDLHSEYRGNASSLCWQRHE